MRRRALAYLACPRCRSTLTLASVASEAEEHVLEGELRCSECSHQYPIRRGVPVLLTDAVEPEKSATAARFAEEWMRYADLRPYYGRQFLGWVAPTSPADFVDRVVFEGGCGKGRHTSIIARFGARDVVAVDLGEAAFVAFENTRSLSNAHVVMADVTNPPVRPLFDIALAVGVLHHLPDPSAGAAALATIVRDGGQVVFWVYSRENNAWITRFVDPFRRAVTSKMSYGALRVLVAAPAAALWLATRMFYRPGPGGRGPRLPYGQYLASMRDFPLDELEHIMFDQLFTPIAHYLGKEEVERWFSGGGFRDTSLRFHNQMSWTAIATVDRAAEAGAARPDPAGLDASASQGR